MIRVGMRAHARLRAGWVGLLAGVLLASGAFAADDAVGGPKTTGAALKKLQAVAHDHRTPAEKARDEHRHPVETLALFGIQPNTTVGELWPSGGGYTAIIAPDALGETGRAQHATIGESDRFTLKFMKSNG